MKRIISACCLCSFAVLYACAYRQVDPETNVKESILDDALQTIFYKAQVIYVDADASTGGDGTTWGTAYKHLQDALDNAVTVDEVWVKEGIYKPDCNSTNPTGSNDRTATFDLINGVALYGGFVGTETSREQRDWQANETILSGDLNGDDISFTNYGENSYHVVTGRETDATAILDGFTITAGNANSSTWPDDGGGGMSNYQSSPTITNCTFRGNSAYADGGGMRNWSNSKPMVTNCTFSGNSADFTGGGIYNVNSSSPTVKNCTFSGNSAITYGGGMCNTDSNPTLTNCILWGDSSPTGPEIHNSGSIPIVTYSDIAGGYTGTDNIDEDPLFADADLRLSAGSPCINTGNPAPEYNDPDGSRNDMGAYGGPNGDW